MVSRGIGRDSGHFALVVLRCYFVNIRAYFVSTVSIALGCVSVANMRESNSLREYA